MDGGDFPVRHGMAGPGLGDFPSRHGPDSGAQPGVMSTPVPEANWVRVGTLAEIPRLGSRVVTTAAEDIVIFRTSDDRVFAMHDRCPHKHGKLSQGIVHGASV